MNTIEFARTPSPHWFEYYDNIPCLLRDLFLHFYPLHMQGESAQCKLDCQQTLLHSLKLGGNSGPLDLFIQKIKVCYSGRNESQVSCSI